MSSEKIRIVFMGTPGFAVESLKQLHLNGMEIAGVVTAPDRPSGRGKKLTSSEVKRYAQQELDCPIFQPEKLKDPNFVAQLKELQADLFIVVAFRMLPEVVWSIPSHGTINLHASFLPNYRGAAPINWAIINGETETGISTFLIDRAIDTGRILLRKRLPIGPKQNAGSLHDIMMQEGGALLVKTIHQHMEGTLIPVAQESLIPKDASFKPAPKIHKEDTIIDWSLPGEKIFHQIRGLSPYPSSISMLESGSGENLQIKIFAATLTDTPTNGKPGTLLSDGKKSLQVASGDVLLDLKEIQLAGKKRMAVEDFLRGYQGDISACKLK